VRTITRPSHQSRPPSPTTARLNFLAAPAAARRRSQRYPSIPEDEPYNNPPIDEEAKRDVRMDNNTNLKRKDTTKGPPLRILSLGRLMPLGTTPGKKKKTPG
jgi:hypothetical protein